MIVSMLTLIYQTNHPPIEILGRMPGGVVWRDLEKNPDDQTVPGMLVIRPVAALYFANEPRVRRRVPDVVDAANPRPNVLVVDFSAVPDIDITALDELPAFDANLRDRGNTLWLANINARSLDMIQRLPDADRWKSQLFRDVNDAAEASTSRRHPGLESLRAIPPVKGDGRFSNPAESWWHRNEPTGRGDVWKPSTTRSGSKAA